MSTQKPNTEPSEQITNIVRKYALLGGVEKIPSEIAAAAGKELSEHQLLLLSTQMLTEMAYKILEKEGGPKAEYRSAQGQLLTHLQAHYPIERRGINMMVEREALTWDERRSIYFKMHKGTDPDGSRRRIRHLDA